MKVPFNDLQQQHEQLKQPLIEAFEDVFDSGQFIGKEGNPFVAAFEKDFARFCQARHCIACANGTDAIEIALRVLRIGSGDEVIVPARTWISTAEAVSHVGARPIFVDVDPLTKNIDSTKIRAVINSRTKAIIPVHLFGLPADMDEIVAIASEHDLKIIEDAAQAHGAFYKDQPIGSFGDLATFSFFPGKNLGCLGDAGCIITNDDDLATRTKRFTDHGRSGRFDHEFEGRNSRMDGIQAAFLSVKLKHLEEWTRKRQEAGSEYRKALHKIGLSFQETPSDRTHVYHVFAIEVDKRDHVREVLNKAGVSSGIHYPLALPFSKAYQVHGYQQNDFPVAFEQMTRTLSLPIFPDITVEQIRYVAASLAQAIL